MAAQAFGQRAQRRVRFKRIDLCSRSMSDWNNVLTSKLYRDAATCAFGLSGGRRRLWRNEFHRFGADGAGDAHRRVGGDKTHLAAVDGQLEPCLVAAVADIRDLAYLDATVFDLAPFSITRPALGDDTVTVSVDVKAAVYER